MNNGKEQIHDKETHGMSGDIDENSSPEKVKGPNLIERAKEEVEAIVGAIHHPNKHHHHHTKVPLALVFRLGSRQCWKSSREDLMEKEKASMKSDKNGKEEEMKTHKKETHGTSTDIDEDTPTDKVKGPNIFVRAKEEIEAIVDAIHPHKDSDH